MESSKNKVALAAAIVVVIVVAIYVGLRLLGPSPAAWTGTKPCRLGRCTNPSGINCINFTGVCTNNICQEQLAGGADCAAGWVKESTDGSGQAMLAKCDSTTPEPYCKWETAQPCGRERDTCCATGRCNAGLICSREMTCQVAPP
jgi:hypothetical protein